MHRKALAPLLVLTIASAVAACGDSFTEAPDGGPAGGDDTIEGGRLDGSGGKDGSLSDGSTGKDGNAPDDAGGGDASGCSRTCPAGFVCAGKCVDNAASHFSLRGNPAPGSNWTYGYATTPQSPPTAYMAYWRAASTVTVGWLDVWSSNRGGIELSVFDNSGSSEVEYAGMKVPAQALGLYPTTDSTLATVARWVAPASGTYDLAVDFQGISNPPAKVTVGISFNGMVGLMVDGMPTSIALNQGSSNNEFMFSVTEQMLKAGDTLDFYVEGNNSDDAPGGVTLKATITAE